MKRYFSKTMKYCILLFVIFILCDDMYAQDTDSDNYSSEPPVWVQKRLNPDQYRMLVKLSEYYSAMDYSIFKRRDIDTVGLYDKIRLWIKDTQKDTLHQVTRCTFLLSGKSRAPYKVEKHEYIVADYLIYSSVEGYDAHVMLTLSYYIDNNGYPRVIECHAGSKSMSGVPVRFKSHTGGVPTPDRFDYDIDRQQFNGYISGVLFYIDPYGKEHREEVSENFTIDYDPDQLK